MPVSFIISSVRSTRCSCKYEIEAKNVNYFYTKCHNNRLNFIINAALYLWHTVAIFEEHGDSKLHSHETHRISWQIKMGKEHLTKTFCKVPQIFILLSPVITINPERNGNRKLNLQVWQNHVKLWFWNSEATENDESKNETTTG